MKKAKNVDEYITRFPGETQQRLKQFQETIKRAAPDAEELISYGMPGYKTFGRPLVYFAGFRKHIGFYALPTGHKKFSKALSAYKQGKGSVQFPLNQPVPWDLIEKMVQFRVEENKTKHK